MLQIFHVGSQSITPGVAAVWSLRWKWLFATWLACGLPPGLPRQSKEVRRHHTRPALVWRHTAASTNGKLADPPVILGCVFLIGTGEPTWMPSHWAGSCGPLWLGYRPQTALVPLLQERLSKEPKNEVAQCRKEYPNPGGNQAPNRLPVFPDEKMASRVDDGKAERNADKPTETQPARHEAPFSPKRPFGDDKTWRNYRCNPPLEWRICRHRLVATQHVSGLLATISGYSD
jgi:hypothetical protein